MVKIKVRSFSDFFTSSSIWMGLCSNRVKIDFSSLERSRSILRCLGFMRLVNWGSMACRTCSVRHTRTAPLRIRRLVPLLRSSAIRPGTANTSRFWSSALNAVRIAPLLCPASTIIVPWLSPLMMRFRYGKLPPYGLVPKGNSEMTVPFCIISCISCLFSAG